MKRGRPKFPELYVPRHEVEEIWQQFEYGLDTKLAPGELEPNGKHLKALVRLTRARRGKLSARDAIERLHIRNEITRNYANRVVATAVNTGVVTPL